MFFAYIDKFTFFIVVAIIGLISVLILISIKPILKAPTQENLQESFIDSVGQLTSAFFDKKNYLIILTCFTYMMYFMHTRFFTYHCINERPIKNCYSENEYRGRGLRKL